MLFRSVGEATVASLVEFGVRPDIVPATEQTTSALLDEWPHYDSLTDPINRVFLPRVEFKHMENTVVTMLRRALDAYARVDAVAAASVVKEDDTVDAEFDAIVRQLITHMMEDPRTISRAIDLLFVSKALERIGDHAKNMCEYVVYLVKGRDVRHLAPDEIVQQAAKL